MRYLPLVLLLAGCPANVHTGAWVSGQDGQTLNTKQRCERSSEAVRAADVALPIILQLYEAKGYCKDYEQQLDWMRGHLSVCLIDQPEPCGNLPWPRSGCASDLQRGPGDSLAPRLQRVARDPG